MTPLEVIYRGDVFSTSGYARAVRNNIRAMVENNVDVVIQGQRHDDITFDPDPFWKFNISRSLRQPSNRCRIRITQQTPDLYVFSPNYYEIGYTVFETSRIPFWDVDGIPSKNWVTQLNRCQEVWTASEFCKKVFQESGVTRPIYVFPHPIDLNVYSPGPRKPLVIGNEDVSKDKMVFLSVFQWNKRKDPYNLLLAWWAEMGGVKDASLVLKTHANNHTDSDAIAEVVRKYKKDCYLRNDASNVYLFTAQLDEERMVDMYRSSDVQVTATKGEGFGLPFQEAQACGVPSIYPNASALPEFARGWPVKTIEEPAHGVHTSWYTVDMNWWTVDISDLRKQFRNAYNVWKANKNAIPQEIKEEARKPIEMHSYGMIGQRMYDRVKNIYEGFEKS